jgi:WD40 repeat protein
MDENNHSKIKPIGSQDNNLPIKYSSGLIKRGLQLTEDISRLALSLPKARVINRFIGHTGRIESLTFSSTGQLLASASRDRTVRLWNIDAKIEYKTLIGHSTTVKCIDFVIDQGRLLSGDSDGDIILWDIESGKELRRFKVTTKTWGKSYWPVTGVKVVNDLNFTILICADDCIRIWDLIRGTELSTYHGPFESVFFENPCSFSEDGKRILTIGLGDICLWDLNGKKVVFSRNIGHYADKAATLSNDGKLAVFWSFGQEIELFDVEKSQIVRHLHYSEPVKENALPIVDPDELTKAYARSEEGMLETVVDDSDDQPAINDSTEIIDDDMFRITSLAMSKDAQFCIGGTSLGEIFMIDLHDGKLKWKIREHEGPVDCIAISPNGKYLTSAGTDNIIILWAL